MRRLIEERIVPILDPGRTHELSDAFLLPATGKRLAFTTDSFVVSPLFFPGGDIGSLAVNGTVNDLAVAGARPRWLSLSLIIEEGFAWSALETVLRSVVAAAELAGVMVVTGDTKVVNRGAADGLFLNTTGIGELFEEVPPGPSALAPGDRLLVSGTIGQHGIAVMSAREQLDFDPQPKSDCAPLHAVVEALMAAKIPIKAMRDATRGGVAAVMHEWAGASQHSLRITADAIPVTAEVRGACELLGLNPMHVANEGTMVVAVPASAVDAALRAMQSIPQAAHTRLIGEVVPREIASVVLRQLTGVDVPLDEPLGSPLSRIC
jgi:hydrogenase expression/formation protein HypE